MATMILERWHPNPMPQWVCCVPSRNHPELVPQFARKLALRLELPFIDAVSKVKNNQPQKGSRTDSISVVIWMVRLPSLNRSEYPMLLVDDIVDSGWTLTVIAALLKQAGSGDVYPVALASSSVNDA